MGMYTELYLSVTLKKDVPEKVLNVLRYLFKGEGEFSEVYYPDPFLDSSRAEYFGVANSWDFTPFATSRMEFGGGIWAFTARLDLKNYDNEIGKFLQFLLPYVDNECDCHIGHVRYEEDREPTLLYTGEEYSYE